MIKIYRECGIPLDEIIGTEGGSKSPLWTQIKADILRGAYNIPARSEGGLMADAAVAAYSVGDISDIRETMREWITFRGRFEPDAKNAARYEKIFAERQKLLAGADARALQKRWERYAKYDARGDAAKNPNQGAPLRQRRDDARLLKT